MLAGWKDPQYSVLLEPVDKESQLDHLLGIRLEDPSQCHRFDLDCVAQDMGVEFAVAELVFQDQLDALGRCKRVVRRVVVARQRSQKLGKDGHKVNQQADRGSNHGHLVFAEAPPHQLPLPGNQQAHVLLGFRGLDRRQGGGGCRVGCCGHGRRLS